MATMAMDMVQKIRLSAVFIALFCANIVTAGDWEFDPSININETYTDNVGLTADDKKSTLVSQTGLNIKTTYQAQHVAFNLSSQSTYASYSHDHEIDNDFHNLDSNLRLQLWPNGIILVGGVNIGNQSKNSSLNAIADIVTADTVQVATYNAGIEYNVNNSDFIINSALGFRQTTSEDNIGDREGLVARLSSTNGTSARYVFWELGHDYQELSNNNRSGKISTSEIKLGLITSYKFNPFLRYYNEDNSGDVTRDNRSIESNAYGLGVRWVITPRLYLDMSYNQPIGSKLDLEGDEQDEYVNAAIKWQPSPRTSLQANISQRFYGNSYGLNFNHKNKRLTNIISYREGIDTLTRNNYVANIIGYYFCPSDSISAIDECILQDNSTVFPNDPSDPDNPGYAIFPIQDFTLVEDNAFSLNKTITWSSVLALPRTTFSFNLNNRERDNLDTRIKDEYQGANLNIKRKVSGNSSVSIVLAYTETNLQIDTEFERSDRYRRYQVNYEKSLNSALSFDLAVSYLNRSSDSTTFNYQEGRVSANITKGF